MKKDGNITELREKISGKFKRLNDIINNKKEINHIILIDDDETSNFITETTLRGYGYLNKITIFDNAPDALKYLKALKVKKQQLPDLILLDIKMPLMDGFEFLDKCDDFCEIKEDVEILLLSSSTYSKDKEKALVRGIDYQTKPLTVDCLNKYI